MTDTTPSPRQRAKAALKDLRKEAGSDSAIAQALTDMGRRITRQAVNHWTVVPEKQLRPVCVAFGKSPKDLRPDLSDFQIARAMDLPITSPPPRRRDRPHARAR